LYKWQQVCAIFNLWLFCPSILSEYRKSILNFIAKKTVLNMKNKEFYKLLKKNKLNSNSGFTLTELLVGLFMSIFVIGALGFGLMTVLRTSQSEGSKAAARNETGRALDFISDELRSAQSIETDNSIAYLNTDDDSVTTSIDETVAPDYDLPAGGTARLALQIPGVPQRVVYSVAPPETGSPWKGPLVIYRWGPELTANGSYSATSLANPDDWDNDALIDKVDDTSQTETCGGASNTYAGFFACVIDDDNDGNTEDLTDVNGDGKIDSDDTGATDKNGDGVINDEDGADVDGKAITAQLFFTGETLKVSGDPTDTDSYSADSQTVARARNAPENNSEDLDSYTMSFRTLQPSFACTTTDTWQMRTDFGETLTNPGSINSWNHEENRQPQPIKISGNKLVISSVPRAPSGGVTDCDNERDDNGQGGTDGDFSGNIGLGDGSGANDNWAGRTDIVAISHEINFKDPRTFNGDPYGCTYPCPSSAGGKVYTQKADAAATLNSSVSMLKYGSPIPPYGGYDVDGTREYDANGVRILAQGDQLSLGEFLFSKGLADVMTGTGATATYTVNNKVKPDERIIGFEIGQTDTTKPGFDLQDNIFIVSSSAFKEKYSSYEESYTGFTPPASLPPYTPLN
jgi:type II secretory pathway pseudopilin PulG